MARERGRTLVAQNRKARHDYHIDATYEAGLVLTGTEVKSLRAGKANLGDGYAEVRDGEVWLRNVHIPEYDQGTWTNHEPRRSRKLLLNKDEISRLIGKTRERGFTLVPLSLYFKDGYAKVEIALARGKKQHDKRHALAEKEAKREADRAIARARRR
ncbi:SsrA-binding protein SmpB [Phytoactinopolyspora halotolerans]|uniref:SsrA-binding protein n=1 Tax=Phytoactinopolyspora halotolerans TaxID=1981512 RepID=A0A6L9SF83_9ACTN|nr:SsrA-binding protein SmpB [Phytoactinopolyspora halotolerans]NEE03314.1 SsrA-binding protein SmpB [Phytoactinopolyspora halotolerans]